jgi:hypothetical protein
MIGNRIWQASAALNCALALFIDHLFNGATNYADEASARVRYQRSQTG